MVLQASLLGQTFGLLMGVCFPLPLFVIQNTDT